MNHPTCRPCGILEGEYIFLEWYWQEILIEWGPETRDSERRGERWMANTSFGTGPNPYHHILNSHKNFGVITPITYNILGYTTYLPSTPRGPTSLTLQSEEEDKKAGGEELEFGPSGPSTTALAADSTKVDFQSSTGLEPQLCPGFPHPDFPPERASWGGGGDFDGADADGLARKARFRNVAAHL
ncbi:hypothetical protein B0H11DRAFT_1936170 [Mycena galericulata]|nr:hypothetical protein B0H11DRAFT_1936170 [Mycena galericulata]